MMTVAFVALAVLAGFVLGFFIAKKVFLPSDVGEIHRLETVRRDFVANVSHELKTPVTAIRGLVETLIDDKQMEAATKDRFLGKIKGQALRLSNLVADLLTLSRLESQKTLQESEKEKFDLKKVIKTSKEAQQPSIESKKIRLQTELPSEPVPVMGDFEALRQSVDNLLGNAVKYTSEQGNITVGLTVDGKEAILYVKDTGAGIEPQHLDRIFERFYRVDKARSRELGGTGLGLSIVKHVAMSHGGSVSVDSTPGVGSIFRIHLPISK